jgi:hypothetical protein
VWQERLTPAAKGTFTLDLDEKDPGGTLGDATSADSTLNPGDSSEVWSVDPEVRADPERPDLGDGIAINVVATAITNTYLITHSVPATAVAGIALVALVALGARHR